MGKTSSQAYEVRLQSHSSPPVHPESLDLTALLQAIKSKQLTPEVLIAYKRALPKVGDIRLVEITAALSELVIHQTRVEYDIHVLILECMTITASTISKSSDCQRILLLGIDSIHPHCRNIAFEGMKALANRGLTHWTFKQKCKEMRARVKDLTHQTVDSLDLLHTFSSLHFICIPEHQPLSAWPERLILSDWTARFKLSTSQRLMLYKNWAMAKKTLAHSDKVIKQLHAFDKLMSDELLEIIKYLPHYSLENHFEVLDTHQSVYKQLRKVWLHAMLTAKFNLQEVDEHYVELLLNKMLTLNIGLPEKMLLSLEKSSTVIELQSQLDFIVHYKITTSQIQPSSTLQEVRNSLEMMLLLKHFRNKDKLTAIFQDLYKMGWRFEEVLNLINVSLTDSVTIHSEESLLHALYVLSQYRLTPAIYPKLLAILAKDEHRQWVVEVNHLMLEINFTRSGVIKNPSQLVSSLIKENEDKEHTPSALVTEVVEDGLLTAIENINSPIFKASHGSELPIAEWSQEDILAWAQKARLTPDYFGDTNHIIQAIAIANRANFLVTGFKLTNTQILSCLMALLHKEKRGRLQQVVTGAGKTVLISVLAIIQALSGKKVDIMTSSSVHAEENAREQAPLYALFGLTVGDNIDRSPYIKEPKTCYQRDIVYGEISQFQFDILRDEYSLLGTKAGRQSEVVILDEVDSIIIDDATKIAKLASTVAGMDQLQPIYFFLWQRMIELQNKFVEIDGKMYFFKGMLSWQDNKIVLRYKDGNDIKEISDLKDYLAKGSDLSKIGQLVEEDLGKFLEQQLLQYFNELVADKTLCIPTNFTEFVADQKSLWIKNALLGLSTFQEYVNYIVQQGLVKPIAFNSNGTVQHSTSWSDGLHQFLQLKHGLHLTSETYTTNFLSNIATIRRYAGNMFGFTGTLGSAKARQVLERTYQVDLINIPNICESQFLQLPTIIADGHDEWLAELSFEAMHEVWKERGALFICYTIEQVQMVEKFMKAKYSTAVIKTYTLNGENQEKEIKRIAPGEIIIATNLAGRGTHINTDAIEHSGGLAVFFCYIPENWRIQWQGFGRTCRQGRLGTGRIIVNKKDLLGYDLTRLSELEKQRDELEARHLEQFQSTDLVRIETKDELFGRFCQLVKKIRTDIRKQSHGLWRDLVDGVTALVTEIAPSVYENTLIAAIEERWAMFLRKIESGSIAQEAIFQEYEKFESTLLEGYQSDKLIQNPSHHSVIANDLLVNQSFLSSDASDKAMQHYDAAIKLDPQSCAAAYVGKAWLILKSRKGSDQQTYKQLAIENFVAAIKILATEMASLKLMQALLQEQGAGPDNDLIQQLSRRIYWLGSYLNSIETAVRSIKKSQRLVALTEQNTFQAQEADKQETYHTDISQRALTYVEIERDPHGKIPKALQANKRYALQLNDLTVQYDSGTHDQAIYTLTAAFKGEHSLDTDYRKISIQLYEVNLEDLQSFLSPHLTFNKLDKTKALQHLREKDSFFSGLFRKSETIEIEVLSGSKKGIKSKLAVSDAVKLVDALQTYDQVTLSFTNANETVKSLMVEFIKLSSLELIAKLPQIVTKTIDLELTGSKEELLAILQCQDIDTVELIEGHPLQVIANRYYKEAAVKVLQTMQGSPLTIKLRDLTHDAAQRIGHKAEKLSINATFNHIDLSASLTGLTEGHCNIQFTQLTSAAAQLLVPRLREEHVDFAMCFDDLSAMEVTALVKKADLKQEDMEISAVKPLSRFPATPTSSDIELTELSARGIEYILELNEKPAVPWRSICAVSMIAGIQIAAGIMLISTGFGAQVGLSVITEGTADLLMACRAYTSRNFAWSDYCKQKAVSLAISVVGLGWQTLQQTRKGLNIYVAVTEEAGEQVLTRVAVNGRALTQTITEAAKDLRCFAFAQVGVSVAEAGAREGLNRLADNISHLCFDHYKPQIFGSIRNQVNTYFGGSQLNRLVKKMLAIDKMRHSSVFQMKIEHTVRESIDPKHAFWRRQWDSVGLPLCKGILSDPKFQTGLLWYINMGIRVMGVLNGIDQLIFVIGEVHSQLFNTLTKLDQEMLSIQQLLQEHCSISKEEAVELTQLLRAQQVLADDDSIDANRLKTADFGKYADHSSKVVLFLQSLHQSMQEVDTLPSVMMISEAMTSHIIRAAESHLVAPLTSLAVSSATSSVSRKMQDVILRQQLVEKMQANEESLQLLKQKENPSDKEKTEIAKLQFDQKECEQQLKQPQITVVSKINHSAKRLSIAYTQRNIVFFAQKTAAKGGEFKPEETRAQQEVGQYADAVKQGKSATLYEMMLMDTLYGTNIKVVVDPNYQLTQEDRDNQFKVVVFIRDKDDASGLCEVGHWQLLGDTEETGDDDSQKNDCGYKVFAKLTGKSVDQLRGDTAQTVLANPDDFRAAMDASDWLVTEHPMEAHDLLFNGGKKEKIKLNPHLPTTEIYFISEPLESWEKGYKYHHSLRHMAIIINDPVKGLIRIELEREGNTNDYSISPLDQVTQTSVFSKLTQKGTILYKMGEVNNFSLEQAENWAKECVGKYPTYGPGEYTVAEWFWGKNKNCRGFVDYIATRLFKYNPAKFDDRINIRSFYECPVNEFEHRLKKDGRSNVPYNRPIGPKPSG